MTLLGDPCGSVALRLLTHHNREKTVQCQATYLPFAICASSQVEAAGKLKTTLRPNRPLSTHRKHKWVRFFLRSSLRLTERPALSLTALLSANSSVAESQPSQKRRVQQEQRENPKTTKHSCTDSEQISSGMSWTGSQIVKAEIHNRMKSRTGVSEGGQGHSTLTQQHSFEVTQLKGLEPTGLGAAQQPRRFTLLHLALPDDDFFLTCWFYLNLNGD